MNEWTRGDFQFVDTVPLALEKLKDLAILGLHYASLHYGMNQAL